MLRSILKAVRPHQWVKNLFVAAPRGFRETDRRSAVRSARRPARSPRSACCRARSTWSTISSTSRRIAPTRSSATARSRPVRSSRESRAPSPGCSRSPRWAAAWRWGWGFALTAAGYLALNVAYSLRLKRIAFVDVACISLGFLLRVLAGAFAIAVPPSRWLLVCTLLLSALLGFGKRAHELRIGGEGGHKHREVLGDYNPRRAARAALACSASRPTLAYLALHAHPAHQRAVRRRATGVHGAVRRRSASTASSASSAGPTPPTAPPIRCSTIRRSS